MIAGYLWFDRRVSHIVLAASLGQQYDYRIYLLGQKGQPLVLAASLGHQYDRRISLVCQKGKPYRFSCLIGPAV